MPALVKVKPQQLKDILVLDGWRVYLEDSYNWSLVKGEGTLEIPKKGKLVSFDVLDNALVVAEMPPGRYLELREQVCPTVQLAPLPSDAMLQ